MSGSGPTAICGSRVRTSPLREALGLWIRLVLIKLVLIIIATIIIIRIILITRILALIDLLLVVLIQYSY